MRLPQLLGLGMLMLALLVSAAASQDNNFVSKDEKKDDKKKDEKKKSGLPGAFKGIVLTDEQQTKIAKIQETHKPKIDELTTKLNEAKKMELNEILMTLTADQRKMYDENVANAKKKKDKKKDEKKGDK